MRLAHRGVLALSALVAGCGGDANVDGSIEDLATELCDLAFRCCERGEIDYYLGPFVVDEANCVERLRQNADVDPSVVLPVPFEGLLLALPNVAVLERAVAEERATIDGAGLAACIEYLQGLECNMFAGPPPLECVPPEALAETPCDSSKIVVGRVGENGKCSSPGFTLECQEGLICRALTSLGVDGACVPLGVEGDFCFDDSECHVDLYCSLLDGTCQVPRGVGESCAYSDPDDPAPSPATLLIECEDLLGCDPVTDSCVEACSRGASCFGDDDCDEAAGLLCILDRCDLPRTVGLPCAAVDDCETGLRCAPDEATGELTCLEPLADGETCSTARPQDCSSGFCNPSTSQCAPSSPPGGLCPSASHTQCDGGYCRTTFQSCTLDSQCASLSGTCNLTAGRCEYYCIERLPDGGICVFDYECASNDCVNGFCRTTPLADGQPCDSNFQCANGFCNFEPTRVCEALPLPNGRACNSSTQCESEVCFNGSCQAGQSEGGDCTSFADPPCAADLYCDYEQSPALCVPVLPAGSECSSSSQCRGACVTRFGRQLCDSTPDEEAAVCDGM